MMNQVDMRKEAGELNDREVSSDEEAMMQTPAPSQNGSIIVADTSSSGKEKRVSAPTSFPSNFSTIR